MSRTYHHGTAWMHRKAKIRGSAEAHKLPEYDMQQLNGVRMFDDMEGATRAAVEEVMSFVIADERSR